MFYFLLLGIFSFGIFLEFCSSEVKKKTGSDFTVATGLILTSQQFHLYELNLFPYLNCIGNQPLSLPTEYLHVLKLDSKGQHLVCTRKFSFN